MIPHSKSQERRLKIQTDSKPDSAEMPRELWIWGAPGQCLASRTKPDNTDVRWDHYLLAEDVAPLIEAVELRDEARAERDAMEKALREIEEYARVIHDTVENLAEMEVVRTIARDCLAQIKGEP